MKMSLSVLIACYNVSETVEAAVRESYEIGKKVANPLEILVIDDGSTDETAAILRRLKTTILPLRIITHKTNQGYGRTIKELYESGRNEWLFTVPGDKQVQAKELLKLLPYTQKADLILGQRAIRNDPFKRRLQSNTYNRLLQVFFHVPTHDVNTVRLMKREIMQKIHLVADSAFVDGELIIKAHRKGFRILEIPITHKKRESEGATGGEIFRTILPTIVDMFRCKDCST